MKKKFDAVLVPGGGILGSATPTPWVQKRLDKALEISESNFIITLSAGTTHKPPFLTEKGYPIFESEVSANYLIQKGYDHEKILIEHHSYDTIGNAYFARMIHTEPGKLEKLAVVTSEFHIERTMKIFDWIFSLPPLTHSYSIEYVTTENFGIAPENLTSRKSGEKRRVASLNEVSQEIKTLYDLHTWLFKHHNAYAVRSTPAPTSEKEIHTY